MNARTSHVDSGGRAEWEYHATHSFATPRPTSVCMRPWKSQTKFASEVPGSEHRMDLGHR